MWHDLALFDWHLNFDDFVFFLAVYAVLLILLTAGVVIWSKIFG